MSSIDYLFNIHQFFQYSLVCLVFISFFSIHYFTQYSSFYLVFIVFYSIHHLPQYASSSLVFIIRLPARVWAQWAIGAKGPQGPKGHRAQRAKGSQRAKGGQRAIGAKGPKGHRVQRAIGTKGPQGPKGHRVQRAGLSFGDAASPKLNPARLAGLSFGFNRTLLGPRFDHHLLIEPFQVLISFYDAPDLPVAMGFLKTFPHVLECSTNANYFLNFEYIFFFAAGCFLRGQRPYRNQKRIVSRRGLSTRPTSTYL